MTPTISLNELCQRVEEEVFGGSSDLDHAKTRAVEEGKVNEPAQNYVALKHMEMTMMRMSMLSLPY